MIDAHTVERIAVTGHRPLKLGGYQIIPRLEKFAHETIKEERPKRVITGLALGWDQAVAVACVELRVPFIAAVPFRGQEARWPESARHRYRVLLDAADEVVVVSKGGYSAKAMQVRNKWMVDRCSMLLALWDGSPSGTANCIEYADGRVPWMNVWDQWTAGGDNW